MFSRRFATVALVLTLFAPAALIAQSGLRDLLTNFLRDGITLAPPALVGGTAHVAHFNSIDSPQFVAVRQFNESLANQLSSFPLASSAGGFTYQFDPAVGFTRASESFGPIYADRSDTIGRGKFNLGLNYSHFRFDRLNDLSLRDGDIKLVFTHAPTQLYVGGDVITANLFVKLDTDITALVFSYGVSDRFDVGAAIPIVRVSLEAQTDATVQRLATGPSDNPVTIHRFLGETSAASFRQSGSASGVGDIVVRGKLQLVKGAGGGLALAADVRFPTGEERDLLGTGATQGKALLIGSLHLGRFSPHFNAGYTASTDPPDDRRTAQERAAFARRTIPDEISYTGGFDWAVHPRVTLAVDVDRKSTRLNSSHSRASRMPSSA